jgi:hypothetical protein
MRRRRDASPLRGLGPQEKKMNESPKDEKQLIEKEYPGDVLSRVFEEAGKRHGFENTQAEFSAFSDFKIRWTRAYKWTEFKVSDYLADAPKNVIEEMAETHFKAIRGMEEGVKFPETVIKWLENPEFAQKNQATYLKRNKAKLKGKTNGKNKNLEDSLRRLIEAGLAEADPSIRITWEKNKKTAGKCYRLMRIIGISEELDANGIPDRTLDYCLYRYLCMMTIGFNATKDEIKKSEEATSKHPKKEEAELLIKKMGMQF